MKNILKGSVQQHDISLQIIKRFFVYYYLCSFNLDLDDKHIKDVLKWSANRLTFIQDLITPKFAFIWIKPEIYDIPGITKGIKTLK